MKHLLLLTGVLFFFFLAVPSAFADELLLFKPHFRAAEELLPAARAALGEGGTVSLDERTNTLVLSGDAPALARAKQALTALDVKPRTVRLTLQIIGADEYENLGVAVEWTLGGGGWQVGRLGERATGGRLAAEKRIDRSSDATRLEIRVLEGSKATLIEGRQTTYEPEIFGFDDQRGPRLTGQVRHETVSLEVMPRIIGKEIQLEILPQRVVFKPQGEKAFPLIETSSTVRLADGETFLLGASQVQANDHAHRLFSGLENASATASRLLLIQADIEE